MDKDPHRLDYATPEAPPSRFVWSKVAFGCLSVVLLLFGLPILILGLIVFVDGMQEPNRFGRSGREDECIGVLIVGSCCILIALRWGWYAFRRRGGG